MREQEGLGFLINQIHKGHVADEAYANYGPWKAHRLREEQQAIGEASEIEAQRTITLREDVVSYHRFEKFSPEDMHGIDAEVVLTSGEAFYLQIKSSRRGMENFAAKHSRDITSGRISMINGNRSPESISHSFDRIVGRRNAA